MFDTLMDVLMDDWYTILAKFYTILLARIVLIYPQIMPEIWCNFISFVINFGKLSFYNTVLWQRECRRANLYCRIVELLGNSKYAMLFKYPSNNSIL